MSLRPYTYLTSSHSINNSCFGANVDKYISKYGDEEDCGGVNFLYFVKNDENGIHFRLTTYNNNDGSLDVFCDFIYHMNKIVLRIFGTNQLFYEECDVGYMCDFNPIEIYERHKAVNVSSMATLKLVEYKINHFNQKMFGGCNLYLSEDQVNQADDYDYEKSRYYTNRKCICNGKNLTIHYEFNLIGDEKYLINVIDDNAWWRDFHITKEDDFVTFNSGMKEDDIG